MSVRFSGHKSFPCRYAWLPKAVAAIAAKRELFADEEKAMEELGVGKNMVRSIRFWVEATGMAAISQSGGLAGTGTGLAVLGPDGFDRYLEDIQTLWLIHWNLASNVRNPCSLGAFYSVAGRIRISPNLLCSRFLIGRPRRNQRSCRLSLCNSTFRSSFTHMCLHEDERRKSRKTIWIVHLRN